MSAKPSKRTILARIDRLYAASDKAMVQARMSALTPQEQEIYLEHLDEWAEWLKSFDTDAEAYAAMIGPEDVHNSVPKDLPDSIVKKLFGYDPAKYRITEADTVDDARLKYEAFCDLPTPPY